MWLDGEGREGGEGVVGWMVGSRRGEGSGLPEVGMLVCLRLMAMVGGCRNGGDVSELSFVQPISSITEPSFPCCRQLPVSSAATGGSARPRDRETETMIPTPTTPPQKLLLHVPLRETVGAMKVLIGAALRVASREAATTALRALCDDGGDRSANDELLLN